LPNPNSRYFSKYLKYRVSALEAHGYIVQRDTTTVYELPFFGGKPYPTKYPYPVGHVSVYRNAVDWTNWFKSEVEIAEKYGINNPRPYSSQTLDLYNLCENCVKNP
jgi:hypothetical protein